MCRHNGQMETAEHRGCSRGADMPVELGNLTQQDAPYERQKGVSWARGEWVPHEGGVVSVFITPIEFSEHFYHLHLCNYKEISCKTRSGYGK